MKIEEISNDGFFLNKTMPKINNVAFISLRSSLISFFETYDSVKYSFHQIIKDTGASDTENSVYGITYIEKCCQAITNFHHFVELILKDILRDKHALLSIDVSSKHSLLFDLIFDNEVDGFEIEKTKQLEFSLALERIVALIKANKINAEKYQFISDAQIWLKALNMLRNRIAHRGIFVIRYKALDYLFGKYALPFLLKVTSLPEYNSNHLWKYKKLAVEIDPILEIIKTFEKRKYWPTKIALLKELAIASYKNPLIGEKFGISFDNELIKRSEALTKYVSENENSHAIENCPVCGTKALVLFNDYFDEEDEHGNTVNYYRYTYRIQCFCCFFELENEINDLDKMKLPIKNFWEIV